MNSHNIECPWCGSTQTVFNMAWTGIECSDCREYIPNPQKILLNVGDGRIVSLQSVSDSLSDNYWVVIPTDTSSSIGFHSWRSGMRMSSAFTLEYAELCNLHEAIGMALEECGHAVSRKSRGDKNKRLFSDTH